MPHKSPYFSTENLKSCPFCGGMADFVGDFENNDVFVQCSCCRNRTAFQTRDEAIDAWNRRVSDD